MSYAVKEMFLTLQGEGEAGARGAPPGDLYIFLHVKRHAIFEREGTTLFARAPISFTTAALGGTMSIPGLDGKRHDVKIPAGIQSGKQLRQRGAGMPVLQGRGHGDLVIQVDVETPSKLTTRQRALLEEFRETETGDECPQSQGFFTRLGEGLLGMAKFLDEALIGLGLLDRIEILALDIFQQGNLQRLAIAIVADDDGHFVQPRTLRCAPAALARDDLIIMAVRPPHRQGVGQDRYRLGARAWRRPIARGQGRLELSHRPHRSNVDAPDSACRRRPYRIVAGRAGACHARAGSGGPGLRHARGDGDGVRHQRGGGGSDPRG